MDRNKLADELGLKIYERVYKYQFNLDLRQKLHEYSSRLAFYKKAREKLNNMGFFDGDTVMARVPAHPNLVSDFDLFRCQYSGKHVIGTLKITKRANDMRFPIVIVTDSDIYSMSSNFGVNDIRIPKS